MNDSSNAAQQMVASSVESPSALAERRELGVLLADALAELSPEYQQIIRLRNIEALDWPEIARKMGRSEGAVRKLWTRALKQLRPLIESRL